MKVNLNVYQSSGELRHLQRFEIYEGQDVVLPDGAVVLYASVLVDGDGERLEVWAAVPKNSYSQKQVVVDEQPTPQVMSIKDAIDRTDWDD